MKKAGWSIFWFLFLSWTAYAAEFTLESPHLILGGTMAAAQVLNDFGCTGQNISPELNWKNAPEGTQSFAVTVYDPDAPTGSGWWHWTVFNIPASVSGLPAGAGKTGQLPKGAIEGRTDYGRPGYGGACPPEGHGPHRYLFRVWALDTAQLPLDGEASGALVGYFLNKHQVGMSEIVVTFGR